MPRSAHPRFVPNREIAALEWVTPKKAKSILSYPVDIEILQNFVHLVDEGVLRTFPIIALRHAKALGREEWDGKDAARPLGAPRQEAGERDRRAAARVRHAQDHLESRDALRQDRHAAVGIARAEDRQDAAHRPGRMGGGKVRRPHDRRRARPRAQARRAVQSRTRPPRDHDRARPRDGNAARLVSRQRVRARARRASRSCTCRSTTPAPASSRSRRTNRRSDMVAPSDVSVQWARVPDRAARRDVAWELLRTLLPDPSACITNTCERCGGPHGRVRVEHGGVHAAVAYAGGWAFVCVAPDERCRGGRDRRRIDERPEAGCCRNDRHRQGRRDDLGPRVDQDRGRAEGGRQRSAHRPGGRRPGRARIGMDRHRRRFRPGVRRRPTSPDRPGSS